MPENDVKLTKLAKCAGCGAKVGAGVLAQLLDGIQVHRDPNLLVGFDKSDDASVYKVSDDLALVQTVDFFARGRSSAAATASWTTSPSTAWRSPASSIRTGC